MSWIAVAKKDFRDAIRAKSLWGLTALFVLLAGGAAYAYAETDLFGTGEGALSFAFMGGLQTAGSLLVPIIALMIGYKAIVGERESGSLKFLMSLPHTRRDVVLGKLVGRTLVVGVPVVVGYLVAAAIAIVLFNTFPAVDFVLFTLLTVLFGLAYISVAVGASSAVSSTSRATWLAFGLWFVFVFGWNILVTLVYWAIQGFSLKGLADPPAWITFLMRVTPNGGYSQSSRLFLNVPGEFARAPSEFFLQDWFGLLILAFWVVVPVGLGYLRFRSVDL